MARTMAHLQPNTGELTIEAALRRLATGDEEAWAWLSIAFEPRIRRLARHLVGPGPLADDAVQESLLRIKAAAPRFIGKADGDEASAQSWLLRVAAHSCFDLLRKHGRALERDRLSAQPLSQANDPADEFLRSEDAASVRHELAKLPERHRTALALRFSGDLNFATIGRALNTSAATARMRVHRALARLETRLRKRGVQIGAAAAAACLGGRASAEETAAMCGRTVTAKAYLIACSLIAMAGAFTVAWPMLARDGMPLRKQGTLWWVDDSYAHSLWFLPADDSIGAVSVARGWSEALCFRTYNAKTLVQTGAWTYGGKTPEYRVSPDGEMVLVMDIPLHKATVYAERNGYAFRTFAVDAMNAAFSHDRSQLVIEDLWNEVHCYDLESGQEIATFASPANWLNAIEFSPDDDRFLTLGRGDGVVHIRDSSTGHEVASLALAGGAYTQSGLNANQHWLAQWSPDGSQIATCNANLVAQVWDSRTGALIRSFEHPQLPQSLAWSADQRRLLVACRGGEVLTWDVSNGIELPRRQERADLFNARFIGDRYDIATSTYDHATLWRDGKAVPSDIMRGWLAISQDGGLVLQETDGRAYDPNEVTTGTSNAMPGDRIEVHRLPTTAVDRTSPHPQHRKPTPSILHGEDIPVEELVVPPRANS